MLVDDGKLALDEPLGYDFLPAGPAGRDPRSAITLRHVLNMSSGLEPVDNGGREYAIGSGPVVLGRSELGHGGRAAAR